MCARSKFLSTPSARRATCRGQGLTYRDFEFLSTPSARRATVQSPAPLKAAMNFYPRPPRGGRPYQRKKPYTAFKFLSTPSARRATYSGFPSFTSSIISIHALREEGDDFRRRDFFGLFDFYPRPPRGGRLHFNPRHVADVDFYPRPPRGGRRLPSVMFSCFGIFLSTPSARRATYSLRFSR